MQNLTLRLWSATALIFVFLLPLFLSPNLAAYFRCFLMWTIAFAIDHEWARMTKHQHSRIGLYIALSPIILLMLQWSAVIAFFALLWTVDTFAFIGGKIFQGPKLIPKISPNKTFSGLICGTIACCIMLHVILIKFPYYGTKKIHLNGSVLIVSPLIGSFSVPILEISLGILFALLAQAGDLFVSFYKRKFNVKDTGDSIPGHGGVLDRFDGIIFAAPATCLFLLLYLSAPVTLPLPHLNVWMT